MDQRINGSKRISGLAVPTNGLDSDVDAGSRGPGRDGDLVQVPPLLAGNVQDDHFGSTFVRTAMTRFGERAA
jgi:hypothetical protein